MPLLLKLKHWQLFLVLVVLPIFGMVLFQLAMFAEMLEFTAKNASSAMNHSFDGFPATFKWFPLLFISVSVPLFSWLWSFGITMHKYIPHPRMMRLGRFKAFIIIPFAYFILLSLWMVYLFQSLENMTSTPEPLGIPKEIATIILSMIIIIPLHFFSLFCIIYTLRFCAKALVSAELGREAHFGDYIGEFFLIWINFVGLWFIQPRIQAVIQNKRPTNLVIDELTNPPDPAPDQHTLSARKTTNSSIQEQPKDEKPLNFKPDGDPFEHDNDFDGIL